MSSYLSRIKMKWILVILVVVAFVYTSRAWNIQDRIKELLIWINGLGLKGVMVYIGLYIAACVFFLPGFIITLGGGAIYGVVWGSVYVSVGSTLGATCAFLLGRTLARDWIAKKIEQNAKFQAIDEAVAREGWKIVLLTRLSPVFPFNLLNYSFGLTKVSLKDYFFASWLGMLPGTIMYVYIGSLAGSLATLGQTTGEKTVGEKILYAVGLLVTVAVTVYVTRIARRALGEKVGETVR